MSNPVGPAWVRTTTLKKAERGFPAFLPVDGPQWRLVDDRGAMLRGGDGRPLCFDTDEDALAFLKDAGITLHKPWEGPGGRKND